MYLRLLEKLIPKKESWFLFGPRQTGKTTLIESLGADMSIDLLSKENFVKYCSNPDLLYEEVAALKMPAPKVWIDECQKVPALLESVHRSMNHFKNVQFILTGSSARKLKRGAANLLGGRALDLKLHALSQEELRNDFQLESVLKYGSLPKISTLISQKEIQTAIGLLRSYVTTYLAEEIHEEAQIRNLDYFRGFLNVAASLCAQQISFANVATLAQISQHQVRKYFSILEDTLIAFFLQPYSESTKKRMSKQPKLYLFDNGVCRAIQGLLSSEMSNIERGIYFEQWMIQEIVRFNDYYQKDFRLFFWRTSHGAEVDVLITRGKKILMAIEFKSNSQLTTSDFSGLEVFKKVHPKVPRVLCAPVKNNRLKEGGIEILNSTSLLEKIKSL